MVRHEGITSPLAWLSALTVLWPGLFPQPSNAQADEQITSVPFETVPPGIALKGEAITLQSDKELFSNVP